MSPSGARGRPKTEPPRGAASATGGSHAAPCTSARRHVMHARFPASGRCEGTRYRRCGRLHRSQPIPDDATPDPDMSTSLRTRTPHASGRPAGCPPPHPALHAEYDLACRCRGFASENGKRNRTISLCQHSQTRAGLSTAQSERHAERDPHQRFRTMFFIFPHRAGAFGGGGGNITPQV